MNKIKSIVLAAGLMVLAGCATDAPKAAFTQPLAKSSSLCAGDGSKINVDAATGVSLMDYEKERLAETIEAKINAKQVLNPAGTEKRQFEIDVTITRYDKGSAFGRLMLAGVGQIHVDGHVYVYQLPAKEKVGEFNLAKTFAWGGMYGATTTIEDAEQGFAEGIANAVTGQSDVPPAKNKGP